MKDWKIFLAMFLVVVLVSGCGADTEKAELIFEKESNDTKVDSQVDNESDTNPKNIDIQPTCDDWITTWKDDPSSNLKKVSLQNFDEVTMIISVMNPCKEKRTLYPDIYEKPRRDLEFKFDNESYEIEPGETVDIPLTVSITPDVESFLEEYTIYIDLLKKQGLKSSNPLKLQIDYSFAQIGKERFCTRLIPMSNEKQHNRIYNFFHINDSQVVLSNFQLAPGADWMFYTKGVPFLRSIDTKTGEVQWEYFPDDLPAPMWYKIIDNKLYLKTHGSDPNNFSFEDSEFISINLKDGKNIFRHNIKRTTIYHVPNEAFYFVDGFGEEESGNTYVQVGVKSGGCFYKNDFSQVYKTLENGVDIRFIDNGENYESDERKVTIKRVDPETNQTLWQIDDRYKYAVPFSYRFNHPSPQPSVWHLKGGEAGLFYGDCMWFYTPQKYEYFAYSNNTEFGGLGEGNFMAYCDGVGCLDIENGKIVWEQDGFGRFQVLNGLPISTFFEDKLIISRTEFNEEKQEKEWPNYYISKKTGEILDRVVSDCTSKYNSPDPGGFEYYIPIGDYYSPEQYHIRHLYIKKDWSSNDFEQYAVRFIKQEKNFEDRKVHYQLVLNPEDFNTENFAEISYIDGGNCIYFILDDVLYCFDKEK